MKKLILIFIALSFVSVCFAIQDKHKAVIARKNATTSCPAFYAQALLSWDGDHNDGTLKFCGSNGTVVETGVLSGSGDISTYGENSSNALRLNSAEDNITITQSANEYFKGNGTQTICIKAYLAAYPDSNTFFFQTGDGAGGDGISIYYSTGADEYYAIYYSTDNETIYDYPIPLTSWVTLAYAWDNDAQTGLHAIYCGDGVAYSESTELDYSMGVDPTTFEIGSQANAPSELIYIDSFAIVDSYKFDCDTLTGW